MKILDGKTIADKKTLELKKEFDYIRDELKRKPILAIIQVGDNKASNQYIKFKMRKAEELGVEVKHYRFKETARQRELLKKLDDINEEADGIIVQLPLPEHLSTQVILDAVRHEKDVDGLSTRNEFNFYNSIEKELSFVPATAIAVLDLMKEYKIELEDKKVAVIGRSHLVGKPTAFLIKKEKANVSTFNKNSGIKGVENADIVIVATGEAQMLKKENIKENAIVIDIGANFVEHNDKSILVGDVDIEGLEGYISALAPVPGGVGPLTVVSLFSNLVKAIKHNEDI
ncbi:bifunctional 5,10-methylenetetrahydrofolate dehydrogenase/5,10-methenyltetrahydrofolate cyclohydrolase [Mycoplasmopsis lipofaciens]|uniref:bifunctional 5,10-methylenetetrahydrofolate dehydrogenase/5,10-methenyltetrahydrofolate cyclohydrolase n=1 Tax=Mycoplasmopsis lipofaciens TaxID=114884 RepID=UPI0004812191|nr:bifunctional 5,10-methylenetetrahydrofolate dehydrogenase/5,10-methenyltetrahydrofolate cyclohydrolase [Mycoplasmopsis lipofaciens]